MIRRSWYLVAAVACFATAPLAAQQPAKPALVAAQHNAAPAMAAAADRTVITISTLGLVLLGVLLIILLT